MGKINASHSGYNYFDMRQHKSSSKTGKKSLTVQKQQFGFEDNRRTTRLQRKLVNSIENQSKSPTTNSAPNQNIIQAKLVRNKLNVAGEDHSESNPIRSDEKSFSFHKTKSTNYWTEAQFNNAAGKPADPPHLRFNQLFALINKKFNGLSKPTAEFKEYKRGNEEDIAMQQLELQIILESLNSYYLKYYKKLVSEFKRKNVQTLIEAEGIEKSSFESKKEGIEKYDGIIPRMQKLFLDMSNKSTEEFTIEKVTQISSLLQNLILKVSELTNTLFGNSEKDPSFERSENMHIAALESSETKGVWKIGNKHVNDIKDTPSLNKDTDHYNLLTKEEFNKEFNEFKKEWPTPAEAYGRK